MHKSWKFTVAGCAITAMVAAAGCGRSSDSEEAASTAQTTPAPAAARFGGANGNTS